MKEQYDRFVNPFLTRKKQDLTSVGDNLWRAKVALNRINDGLYHRGRPKCCPVDEILFQNVVDEILEEIIKLASCSEKWRSSEQNDGEKPIQLGALRQSVYQLEDMADGIEYKRWKQHQAKLRMKLSQKKRLVLKLTEDLLPILRGIIENLKNEFSAENCIGAIRTESVTDSPLQDACVSIPEDGKFEKRNIILEGQSSGSIIEESISHEETSDANDFVPESDYHHNTTEDLLVKMLKEPGNCVLAYGIAQGTVKVTIPVQEILKDKRVQEKFELLVYVRASDRPMSIISPERTLEESILELMNDSIVNIVGASNKEVEEDSRPNKQGSSNLKHEAVIKIDFKENILMVWENVLEDELPMLIHLLSALLSGNSESRMVISSKSSELLTSVSGVGKQKEAVGDIIFWRFFRSFAFRAVEGGPSQVDQDPDEQKKLEETGKRMSSHLNKFPLGAKMIAKMMNTKRDLQLWDAILEKVRRVVKSHKSEHDQLQSLLQICYDQLPAPLRLCFQYCSLFPSNWTFTRDSLVRLWMSQGFLEDLEVICSSQKDPDQVKTADDVGKCYFGELHSRSFFEKLADDGSLYSLHAFVHRFAEVTAGEEFLRIESVIPQKVAVHVCHLSVKSTCLQSLCNVDAIYGLRTLIIFGPINSAAPDILVKILPRLKTTRTIDLAGCALKRLPELNKDLKKHLRYLSIYDTGIEELPKDFGKFAHLKVLNILGCRLKKFPKTVTRLCNLQHIEGPTFLTSEMDHVGKLKALHELEEFPVSKSHEIEELGGMKYLSGSIVISNLDKVKSGNAANKAKLHDKGNLNSLKLEWSSSIKGRSYMKSWPSNCGCNIFIDKSSLSAKVLDNLKPHSDLRDLEINWYIGDRSPSWFTADVLANIVGIRLRNCINWKKPPPFGHFPKLKTLTLEKCDQLKSFRGVIFPMLEELSLEGMPKLLSFGDFPGSFPCLKLLTIRDCRNLHKIPLLGSSVLTEIYLEDVSSLEDLPLRTVNVVPSTAAVAETLTRLTIQNCPKLLKVGVTYDDRVYLPASLLHLKITGCAQIQHIRFKEESLLLRTVHMDKISLLEPHFNKLGCLEELVIEDAELRSLEVFPRLKKLSLINCQKIEVLPVDITQFSSLKSLRLQKCHKISSLPYLPYNLDELHVEDCPLLKKRYQENSAGWSMISHVPYKYI